MEAVMELDRIRGQDAETQALKGTMKRETALDHGSTGMTMADQ